MEFANEKNLHIPDEYGITIDLDKSMKSHSKNAIDNLGNIQVKVEKKENDPKEDTEVAIEVMIVNDKKKITHGTIKRSETYRHVNEFNRYSDPKMQYEMRTIMGITES